MAQDAVKRTVLVQLPARTERALTAEIAPLRQRYAMLEQVAWFEGDHQASARFHNFWYRLSTAGKIVQRGLPVRAAECTGAGAAVRPERFRHFRCTVSSHAVAIPVADLVSSDDGPFPAFAEREPRMIGPYRARLFVHATGGRTPASRQLGEATALTP